MTDLDIVIAYKTIAVDDKGVKHITVHPDSELLETMLKTAGLKSKEQLEEKYHIKIWEVSFTEPS